MVQNSQTQALSLIRLFLLRTSKSTRGEIAFVLFWLGMLVEMLGDVFCTAILSKAIIQNTGPARPC